VSQPLLTRSVDGQSGPFPDRFETFYIAKLRRVIFLSAGNSGRAARYFFDQNFCLNLRHKSGAKRPTKKTIARNDLETTNNLVVLSKLFPLQVGDSQTPKPTILWFGGQRLGTNFWQLDRTLLGFENRALYASTNAYRSPLDLSAFCTA